MNAPSSGPDRVHTRAQRALAERALGLLADTEVAWLDEHLAGCESCRSSAAVLEAHLDLPGEGTGHLPMRLVSRWDTEFGRTPEPVREMVLKHLRTCDQCRSELRMLGHQLPQGVERAAAQAPRNSERSTRDRLRDWLRGSPRGGWMLGGLAAAAALVATFGPVAVRYLQGPRPGLVATDVPADQVPPRTDLGDSTAMREPVLADSAAIPGAIGTEPVKPSIEPQLALAGAGDPEPFSFESISLDQTTFRGEAEGDTANEISVRPGTQVLRATHPLGVLLSADGAERVTISIVLPSGRTLQQTLRPRDLRKDRPLRVVMPEGVEAGVYHFIYSIKSADRDRKIEGEFRVHHP